jgi:hypothetical protein
MGDYFASFLHVRRDIGFYPMQLFGRTLRFPLFKMCRLLSTLGFELSKYSPPVDRLDLRSFGAGQLLGVHNPNINLLGLFTRLA